MSEVLTIEHRSSEKPRGSDLRLLNLRTKLTAIESKAVEEAASGAGEWNNFRSLLTNDPIMHRTALNRSASLAP